MARGPVGGSCSCHMHRWEAGHWVPGLREGWSSGGSRAAVEGDENLLGGSGRDDFTEQWLHRKHHTQAHIHMHTQMHTHRDTQTYTNTYTLNTHDITHICTHTHKPTYICTHAYTNTPDSLACDGQTLVQGRL